ncbi:hypothetical protein PROFUN_08448 [Planoprotostelium fungivorum]|uniref:SH2 domain-containing protein n=1 Tax=Planoprotostelium fungivorum TaxID=1890364 RepID=A0A2P6N1R6_9EUKA|nr:hypothetical protein PROFUN_08448 [Planoprotostelium fungivorum]
MSVSGHTCTNRSPMIGPLGLFTRDSEVYAVSEEWGWSVSCPVGLEEGTMPSKRRTNLPAQLWETETRPSANSAVKMLKGREDGTFLVRTSHSNPSAFTVSVVIANAFYHFRILYRGDSGDEPFVLQMSTKQEYGFGSLEQAVERCCNGELVINNGDMLEKIKLLLQEERKQ